MTRGPSSIPPVVVDRVFRGYGCGLQILGIVLLIPALLVSANRIRMLAHGVTASGNVTSAETSGRAGHRKGLVDFRDATGTSHRVEITASLQVGEQVEVIYLPSDPAGAIEHSWWTTWGAMFLVPLFPILLIAGGRWLRRGSGE